jgi:hypothetical protein
MTGSRLAVSQFDFIRTRSKCHARESGHPEQEKWIPACAGMTLILKLRHYQQALFVDKPETVSYIFPQRNVDSTDPPYWH